jgi:hypothetical protein
LAREILIAARGLNVDMKNLDKQDRSVSAWRCPKARVPFFTLARTAHFARCVDFHRKITSANLYVHLICTTPDRQPTLDGAQSASDDWQSQEQFDEFKLGTSL